MKRFSAGGFISTIALIVGSLGMLLPLALSKPTNKQDVLAASSVYVTGRIADTHGGNIAGATVSISGPSYSSSQYSTSAGFAFIVPGNSSYTITAQKSGFMNASRFVSVGTSAVSGVLITLQAYAPSPPTPTPTLYTNLTICTYKNGGGPINGNVSIKGYSTVSTGSDGCAGYTFLRNQTIFATASAPGYGTSAQTGISLTAANQTKIFYLTPTAPPPPPKPKVLVGSIYDQTSGDLAGVGGTVAVVNTSTGSTKTLQVNSSKYSYSGFAAGTTSYKITYTPPSGYRVTSSNGVTKQISDGQTARVDFVVAKASIITKIVQGRLLYDKNGNGTLDENLETNEEQGDSSFNGITVKISGNGVSQSVLTSKTTNGNGSFSFGNLKPGSYTITVSGDPSGYSISSSRSQTVIVKEDKSLQTRVFFLFKKIPSSIKLHVKTQYQSNVSSPVADTFVTACPTVVTGTGKAVCPNGKTDSSGNLTLTVSANSNLTISASKSPYSGKKEIKTGTTDGNYVIIMTNSATPSPVNTAVIGGTVSVSTATGTHPYIGQNVRVILGIDKSATTTTSETGGYSFKGLKSPGNYSVKIEPPAGYEVVSKNPVSPVNPPSNPKSSEIVNFTIRLSNAGKNDNTIKGIAYHDDNRNGRKDTSEKVFSGIKINLGVTASKSTTTGADGSYQFIGLAPGDYTVRPSIPSGYQGTTDWPGGQVGGTTKSITRDFGIAVFTPTESPNAKTVRGRLLYDKNGNGKIDENPENGDRDGGSGFNGATVKIAGSGISKTTKTFDGGTFQNGKFNFEKINPGTYTVTLQTIPSGYTLVGPSSQEVIVETTNLAPKQVNFILKNSTIVPSKNPSPSVSPVISPSVSQKPSKTPTKSPSPVVTKDPIPSPSTALIYTIRGQVYLKKGSSKQKFTNGKMNITATNTNNQHKTVKINTDGSYEIPNLTQKEYTVSTTAPTNTALTSANNVKVTFNTNQSASVDFTLSDTTPSPSQNPSPSVSPSISPSPSVSPVISPSVSPSVEPSAGPSGSPSPSPSVSPSPIPTDKTSLNFASIFLHGIGKAGDVASPGTVANMHPKRTTRQIKVELTETTNDSNVIASGQGTISYQEGPGFFIGTITLDKKVTAGTYSVKIMSDQYLKKKFKNAIIIQGSDTIVPVTEAAYVETGDVNFDGLRNIQDYDIITGCDESIVGNHCDADSVLKADISDDGVVDFYDYNLFLREISITRGDS